LHTLLSALDALPATPLAEAAYAALAAPIVTAISGDPFQLGARRSDLSLPEALRPLPALGRLGKYRSIYLSVSICIYSSIHPSIHPYINLFTYPSICLSMNVCMLLYISTWISIFYLDKEIATPIAISIAFYRCILDP